VLNGCIFLYKKRLSVNNHTSCIKSERTRIFL